MCIKTDVALVRAVDQWAQENDPQVSAEFNRYYTYAKDTSYGWESVQSSSPDLFADALALAVENKHKI